jgi:N-acetylmuramoyl-L-alanine amidase
MKKLWWIITGITLAAIGGTMAALNIDNITSLLPKSAGKKYGKRNLSQIKYIVIHHSAADGFTAFDYALWHLKRGWPGIGYHYVIEKDGKVNQTNELDTISYHAKDHNTASIGISLSGNLSKHAPSAQQMESLIALIKEIKGKVGQSIQVRGHRELQATECPGKLVDLDVIRNLTR